jgi:predicted DNA-binding protein
MEVQFTPEQEARLAQIASIEGVAPARLVQDAAIRLIEDDARIAGSIEPDGSQKVCPECGHRFRGRGWDGIDAHWRKKNHEHVLPYAMAWPLIQAGKYDSTEREDMEDLIIAERRLRELREGRSQTHSLEEVERELGLVD